MHLLRPKGFRSLVGPIFIRESLTVPRRGRHYLTRVSYLLVLWVLALTTWQAAYGWEKQVSQGDLAQFGSLLFQLLSFLQLTLVLFFSALIAASAITQEKDRRTFVLLLLTDLRNYEIVLGKLFGSLLQIMTLIACAVPVLALVMLLGGVSFLQVILVFMVLVASGLAAGSLGCVLALWRDKTFQTLALTVLALVLYLIVVEAAGMAPAMADWQVRLNPYRAMLAVVEPPTEQALLATQAYDYAVIMVAVACLLTGVGMLRLRVWNPSGEPIQQRDVPDEIADEAKGKVDIHASPGKARTVWPNPILWREMRTRGYGRRPLLVKAAYMLTVILISVWVYSTLPAGRAHHLEAAWGLVPVATLSLILLNVQAVTAITSERDLRSLELLLVSDLTPWEFVFGKLGGIFYNAKEIVIPPFILLIAYAVGGYIGIETTVYIFIALLVLMAFAAALGVHIGLKRNSSRLAIGYSLGTVFFLFMGTMICIYIIAVSGGFGVQWSSFIVFLVVGIGGLVFVLGGERPSKAISVAAGACPPAIFYMILSVLIGDPVTGRAGDPLMPFLVLTSAFGFTIAAMLVPLLSDFEVALDYSGPMEETAEG